MTKKNTEMTAVKNVNELTEKLLADHDAKIAKLENKIEKAESMIADADQRITAARDQEDFDAYDLAVTDKKRAEFSLDVSKNKLEKAKASSIISEEESNKTVNSLLNCKTDLEDQLLKNIAVHVTAINDLLKDYDASIDQIGSSLKAWTNKIHTYNTSMYGFHDGRFVYASNGFIPYSIVDIKESLNSLLQKDHDLTDHVKALETEEHE